MTLGNIVYFLTCLKHRAVRTSGIDPSYRLCPILYFFRQAIKIEILSLFISVCVFNTSFAEETKLDIPVPLNEDVLGIRIPYYNEKGQLEMQLDARLARKTDENHATLKDLKISLFEDNNGTLYIEMPQGVFDLQTNILYGDEGVSVKRQDMDITAQSIIFHTKDRSAHFKGKVKMTILDVDLTKPDSNDLKK